MACHYSVGHSVENGDIMYLDTRLVCSLVQAAKTNYNRLCGLETTEVYFSRFWRLEAQGWGSSMVMVW